MSLNPVRYVHKPLYVNAIQVTPENMAAISEWCKGSIVSATSEKEQHIKVQVKRALNVRQTEAFAGDWVLKVSGGWKVYTHEAFSRDFKPEPALVSQ